jgi:hypothetical protein
MPRSTSAAPPIHRRRRITLFLTISYLPRNSNRPVDLPRRHDRHIARRQLDVYELARRAPLDLNAARASPTQGMPAIVDGDILPDMGRMTARLAFLGVRLST